MAHLEHASNAKPLLQICAEEHAGIKSSLPCRCRSWRATPRPCTCPPLRRSARPGDEYSCVSLNGAGGSDLCTPRVRGRAGRENFGVRGWGRLVHSPRARPSPCRGSPTHHHERSAPPPSAMRSKHTITCATSTSRPFTRSFCRCRGAARPTGVRAQDGGAVGERGGRGGGTLTKNRYPVSTGLGALGSFLGLLAAGRNAGALLASYARPSLHAAACSTTRNHESRRTP